MWGRRSSRRGRRPWSARGVTPLVVAALVVPACAANPPPTAAPSTAGATTAPPGTSGPAGSTVPRGVLLFTRTEGFHHESVAVAAPALTSALTARGFAVTTTDDPSVFSAAGLVGFAAVVFLETSGDVLDPPEEEALQRFVERGGGWAGVHSALDSEYEWPFYETLAGARFLSHPEVQAATVRPTSRAHPSMQGVPDEWVRTDEWYDLRADPPSDVRILATVDEGTYAGGKMGSDHPIAWCRAVGSGQSFVTAMGHTDDSWRDPTFVDHVAHGIEAVTHPDSCR